MIYRDAVQAKFTLSGTDVHGTGVVILSYKPVNEG